MRNHLTSLDFLPDFVGSSVFACRLNPLLGELQQTTDFKEIKNIAQNRKAIQIEHQRLNTSLQPPRLAPSKRYKL